MKTRALLWSGALLGLAAGLAFLATRSPALGADLSWQLQTMLRPPGKVGRSLQH
ncbi:MAG TPA: hypothetical protein PLJ35_07545 [Anaerolineae bacterium]|nr:hypothetical protein [Anaerolineae bacterium]HOQ98661.1 hypothetical protein [Anaerolineae bacterium]HPL28437.1 hypothetical protein [Anaerolineae bacterium]